MVLLNHFLRNLILISFLELLPLQAGVLNFFNPTQENNSDIYSEFDYFIASDPISLYGFFHKWKQDYHPKSHKNIAIQDMRWDIGKNYDKFYLGYFYQYNAYIKTNKDFTDLFYSVKNHIDLDTHRVYNLKLNIDGIKQQGILLSYKDNISNSLSLGCAIHLATAQDMQQGSINGKATATDKKNYHAVGDISYHYTHNYLYKLGVDDTNGYGFGMDIALSYSNIDYLFDIDIIANDLGSRVYWNNLPYSDVTIETNNKSYDEDGYVHYNPSISGKEVYNNFIQKIKPRYKVEITKLIYADTDIVVGSEFAYSEKIPYISINKSLTNTQSIDISYENRFHTFGLDYSYKRFSIGFNSDNINHISAFGIYTNLLFSF